METHELSLGFKTRRTAGWIGVPYPIEARTIDGKVGGLRKLRWERGVEFDKVITAWMPNKRIAWNYKFWANSFPPGSLDDHVVIGGRYFDLTTTSYALIPENGGTALSIEGSTSVSTNFNWYAYFWARFFIGDAEKKILQLYKVRSERQQS